MRRLALAAAFDEPAFTTTRNRSPAVRGTVKIAGNQIKVLIYNVQTATAVTTNLKALAAAHHIPAVGVSETLQPQDATFQDWQLAQLKSLESALAAS